MSDQRIQYNEEMVGAGHPTKSDTLNRLMLVEHNSDGTHQSSLPGFKSGLAPTYKDTDELTFSGGVIEIDGEFYTLSAATDVQFASLAADTDYWVYVSAPGSGTALSASEFAASATAPARDQAKGGVWYNAAGDARAVFGFTTDGSAYIREFFCDGREVTYDTQVADGNVSPSTTYTDVTLTVPALDDLHAKFTVFTNYSDTLAYTRYRKNGTTGYHNTGYGRYTDSRYASAQVICPVDGSGKIEVALSAATSNSISVWTNGYFLPEDM